MWPKDVREEIFLFSPIARFTAKASMAKDRLISDVNFLWHGRFKKWVPKATREIAFLCLSLMKNRQSGESMIAKMGMIKCQ
jgi:hypothetical protein